MTDLELIKLAAEAMDLHFGDLPSQRNVPAEYEWPRITYDPINDDAQAMALVKKFQIMCKPMPGGVWYAYCWMPPAAEIWGEDADLNRAIVKCCSSMQLEKTK